jgi:hypothetical protein
LYGLLGYVPGQVGELELFVGLGDEFLYRFSKPPYLLREAPVDIHDEIAHDLLDLLDLLIEDLLGLLIV